MELHDGGRTGSSEVEARVSFFIPSVELKGSRDEKLRKLDTLIVHLERLRGRLAGADDVSQGSYEGPGRFAMTPTWPWFAAGVLLALLVVAWLVRAGL